MQNFSTCTSVCEYGVSYKPTECSGVSSNTKVAMLWLVICAELAREYHTEFLLITCVYLSSIEICTSQQFTFSLL